MIFAAFLATMAVGRWFGPGLLDLGFPVGMSGGADDPKLAPGRVSVIASIGYCAFLAGSPLTGFLGDRITVLRAVAAVAAMLAMAASGCFRYPPAEPCRPDLAILAARSSQASIACAWAG